ncbi:hypothetical protein CAL7716_107780 (plasmid) [Calothrix sp. PCC 7716]|nr:hypothetical protein CAL7716_107780 [Calothrix sp. PCC 7716]
MTTTRIVLPQKHKPFAEELLAVTGIDSLSNLFVVFLTRYGNHLKTSWNITQSAAAQHFPTPPATYQVPEYSVVPSQINYQKQDSVQVVDLVQQPEFQEVESEIDPVIARLTPLLDRF